MNAPLSLRVELLVGELCESLQRLRQLNDDLLRQLVERGAASDGDESSREEPLEELIRGLIEEEKERLVLQEELGDLLGHPSPSSATLPELLPRLPEGPRKRLTRHRERLRESAQRLLVEQGASPHFRRHSLERVQLYVDRSITR